MISSFIERILFYDVIKTKVHKLRNLQEDEYSPIHGFVTVIKNQGRPDEQVIQRNKTLQSLRYSQQLHLSLQFTRHL